MPRKKPNCFRDVLSTPAGQDLLNELVMFAQYTGIEPLVAKGRADVVLMILREREIVKRDEGEEHGDTST